MDFDLSADQKEIKDVARELLAARSPWVKVREAAEAREYGDALWRELCEHGGGAAVLVLLDGDEAELVEGADAEPLDVIDSTRRYAAVRDGRAEPLGPGAADRVRAAVAAELVGVCQQALDMTLAYV